MDASPVFLTIVGILLAVWTVAAGWVMLRASERVADAEATKRSARRLSRMIEESPAVPLLVRADGRLEGPDRLAGWFGFATMPDYLSELAGDKESGVTSGQLEELTRHVRRVQRTAAPFTMAVTLPSGRRSLALKGSLADPAVSPHGACLIWVFDFTDSESELRALRDEASRAREDFGALVGLIEAAPMPMWFRGADLRLRLVNGAYVRAVGSQSPDEVVEKQIELIEPANGVSASEIARQAGERRNPIERVVNATVQGARRTLRVTDLPLVGEGIAGYAVDIEEMEEQAREFRAFREAQRSMLDQLSVGVAQFDASHQMTFANQPFHRVFALPPGVVNERTSFEQVLNMAREGGRVPEVRDFPAWRAEHGEWFVSDEMHEEDWALPDSTHLRIVAQPLPDGGLVLIAEDRTEQLALSATRDTLLRTRTATFDNLFEALAVFAPDGHLELWNRSLAGVWGIDESVLDGHPQADGLLEAIRNQLAQPSDVAGIGHVIRSATLDRKREEGAVQLADGRNLTFAGMPLPDGNGLLTILDVTASRQAEEALRERNRALEEADAVMTRFLANMSYEFRTPLTSIGGFAELLSAGIGGELPEQARDYAAAISDSVARLTEQVENVLDLSQSEAGLMPLRKGTVDLLSLLTKLVRERESDIVEAGLSLDLKGRPERTIDGDSQQLRRAFAQLLDNAIRYTQRGGKIALTIKPVGEQVEVVLADNGRGMGQAELARAIEGLRPSGEGGTVERRPGLGIPLAHQLVEAHGGSIDIRSRKGTGTTVTILLP